MKLDNISGVWPVMLTPFTDTGEVDYYALDQLVDWYIENGVTGLFAVCQSSEMFHLSLKERIQIAQHVKRRATVPVIASGHVSYALSQQIEELISIGETGVDAVVLITNRMTEEGANSRSWMDGMSDILENLPKEMVLGLYECPYPYKRVLSQEELTFCAEGGRFQFLKDTCCDASRISERLKAINGTEMKLFNANTATLLESLQEGAAGYSGVMANFHPDLYVWLCKNWKRYPEEAKKVQSGLTFASMIEKQYYPNNAKVYLREEGLAIDEYCRAKSSQFISALYRSEIRQLRTLTEILRDMIAGLL